MLSNQSGEVGFADTSLIHNPERHIAHMDNLWTVAAKLTYKRRQRAERPSKIGLFFRGFWSLYATFAVAVYGQFMDTLTLLLCQ